MIISALKYKVSMNIFSTKSQIAIKKILFRMIVKIEYKLLLSLYIQYTYDVDT